jgi:hypothetical protein
MLLFKKKFLAAILSGRKTQTIRLWPRAQFRSGQRSYIPGAGYIWIESVDPVELNELTDEDAVPDGFETAEALRAEIAAIYKQTEGRKRRAFRVRFRLAPDEVKRLPAEEKQRPLKSKRENASAEKGLLRLQAKILLPAAGFLLHQSRKI